MSKIDDVLYMFGDGKAHKVGEVAKAVSLPKYKVRKVLGFLAKFNFIEYDRKRGRAKASPLGMRILSREKKSLKFPVFF